MIFRLTDSATLTANNNFAGMFSGDFFRKKSILSEFDINSLRAYNEEIIAGKSQTEAFGNTMRDSSVAAQNMAKSANGATVNINEIPSASQAATVSLKFLAAAMNIGIMIAVTTLISGITKMIKASEEISKQASEATAKFKEQSDSISEYKDKVKELKIALEEEGISYVDARDKRSELVDIQKQLIDLYGAEASGINLVNGSLDEQIGKLDDLNKLKRQEWENEVNQITSGQKWQKRGIDFLSRFAISFAGNNSLFSQLLGDSLSNKLLNIFDSKTNIERIVEKVEKFNKTIDLKDIKLRGEELSKLKQQLDSYKGVSFNGSKMTISGDAKTVSETITKIQTQVIGSREDLQLLNQDLKDIYNSAKKIVDENWDTYNKAIENKILDDETGLDYYGKLTDAYNTYQEAVKDGNEEAINDSKEAYSKLLDDIANNEEMPESFKNFFENMYPDIAEIINDWKFETKIVPKISTDDGELKDDVDAVKHMTTEQILAAFDNNGAGVEKEVWDAITELNKEAQANGLDLSTFIGYLHDDGYLVSEIEKRIEEAINNAKDNFKGEFDWSQFFNDNSIDTEEELDYFYNVTKGAKTARDAVIAYNSAKKDVSLSDIFGLEYSNGNKTPLGELSEKIDELQDAWGTLQEVSDNYNKTGKITIDQFQKLMSLGDEYLKYIIDENGNIDIQTESLSRLSNAYLENTKAKILNTLIQNITGIESEAAAQQFLKEKVKETTVEYENLNEALLDNWILNLSNTDIKDETSKQILDYYNSVKGVISKIDLGSFAGSAENKIKDYVDSYMEYMKASLEASKIDFATYSRDVAAFLDNMFKSGKISAQEYYDYTKKMLEEQKAIYDKAASGITYVIDKEIKALEKDKESIEESYQAKIDAIQSEIDALEEANDKRKEQMELEKAQYELEKSLNNRTKRVYNGKEFVYTTNAESVRDAQETLADKEREMAISRLEDKIESLEKAMESEIETIDKEIEKYNDYKEKLQEITSEYENAENVKYALAVTGLNNESEILELREGVLVDFKNNYIDIQKSIVEYAWWSANEQIRAAKEAAKGANGTYGVSQKISPNDITPPMLEGANISTSSVGQSAKAIEFKEGRLNENYNNNKSNSSTDTSSEYNFTHVVITPKYQPADGFIDYWTEELEKNKHHTGLDKGYVGDDTSLSKDKRLRILQKSGSTILKPYEKFALLKDGELVLTEEQQKNLVSNLMMTPVDFSSFANRFISQNITPAQNLQPISFSVGEIHLHEVNDIDGLSKAIVNQFPNKILQAINRR